MFGKWKRLSSSPADIHIIAPVSGVVIPLSELSDPTFAQGILGKGVAIRPDEGRVIAPADGTVELVMETGHAVSMTTEDGVELLIHIGLDTVRLCGKHYRVCCESGSWVTRGQTLVEFDPEAIRADGCDPITPVLVCNAGEYAAIRMAPEGGIHAGEPLFLLRKI